MGLFKKKKPQTLQQILETPIYPLPEPIIPYEFQRQPEPSYAAAVSELADTIKAAVSEYVESQEQKPDNYELKENGIGYDVEKEQKQTLPERRLL